MYPPKDDVVSTSARRCGTPDVYMTQQQEEMLRNKMAEVRKTMANDHSGPVTIEVSFQVITNGTAGDIPQQFVIDQIAELNRAYAPHGFQFNLRETNHTDDAELHDACADVSGEPSYLYREKIRNPDDGPDVLYFYTCDINPDQSGGQTLGVAKFPWEYDVSPLIDGVVCHGQTLPGGSLAPTNQGITAVHEVGHW
jgi:hypothetical protein